MLTELCVPMSFVMHASPIAVHQFQRVVAHVAALLADVPSSPMSRYDAALIAHALLPQAAPTHLQNPFAHLHEIHVAVFGSQINQF
jgi:hypothetical protein